MKIVELRTSALLIIQHSAFVLHSTCVCNISSELINVSYLTFSGIYIYQIQMSYNLYLWEGKSLPFYSASKEDNHPEGRDYLGLRGITFGPFPCCSHSCLWSKSCQFCLEVMAHPLFFSISIVPTPSQTRTPPHTHTPGPRPL